MLREIGIRQGDLNVCVHVCRGMGSAEVAEFVYQVAPTVI